MLSGRTTRCNVVIFDGEEFDPVDAHKHVIGSCGGNSFTIVSETWDDDTDVIVGEETCDKCGASHLYTKRPTKQEIAEHAAIQPLRKDDTMLRPNTALYLKGVYPTTETVDQETRKRVVLDFFIQPFTRGQAETLDIAQHLFKTSDGEPLSDIAAIELAINRPLQQMTIKSAPDSTAGLIIDNVRVSKTIKIRSDKEGPILAANFKVDFPYPAPDDLLYLFTGYLDQHFVTFDTMQGSLGLADPPADAPPKKAKKRNEPTLPAPDAPIADTPNPEQPAGDTTQQG